MAGFTESNITLNFPDANFFRFATCKGYTQLSGNNFKEMDACWFDTVENIYWIIELKDFSLASLTTLETIEKRSWDIVKKATDSLCMFISSKHGYPYSVVLNPCFPNIPNNNTQFKFVVVIHSDTGKKADIQLLNEQFKHKFKPYALLFGISHYAVIEHSTAIRIIPNNMIQ